MAFINLGKINKNLIPIVVGSVFCILNRFLTQYEGTLLFHHTIITIIITAFAQLFSIIPHIILKIKLKKEKPDNNKIINNNNDLYIYTAYNTEIVKHKGKYILFSALLFFVQSIFFSLSFEIKSNTWILFILVASIFCYLILKFRLFKHHYLSMILIILIGIIIDLVSENLQNDFSNNLTNFILRLLREIIFSLHHVVDKYIMNTKFVSIYEICFYDGLFDIILFGLFSIFDYYFFHLDSYDEYFNNFNGVELLVVFGQIITQFGMGLSTFLTIKNNSPCHVFIIYVFGQMGYLKFTKENTIVFICLILMLFLSLIFNEIIELNFWGLSHNTKRNIIERAVSNEDLLIIKSESIESVNNRNNENEKELNDEEIYN